MLISIPVDSVGIVTPHTAHFAEPLFLASGQALSHFDIIYETYGELNVQADNAVLICHALSGHHHAAGYHSAEDTKPGWWDACIGPGKVIDTRKFFVVALNNIGGCHGSTGPASLNPETGHSYGADFPDVQVKDWVQVQARLADFLEIKQWAAIVGGSLGGMQVLQWSIDFPERLRHAVLIASTPKLSAQNIAFNEVARQSILSDPDFHGGHYAQQHTFPKHGLMLARMLGHITYLSDEAMTQKFDREFSDRVGDGDKKSIFKVESYLRYQGENFSQNFDANTYLLMTRALDYFDPAADYDNNLAKALARVKCGFLVVSFSTDWRFSPQRSREIVHALMQENKKVVYAEVDAPQGHDSFLLPIPRYLAVFGAYMSGIEVGVQHAS